MQNIDFKDADTRKRIWGQSIKDWQKTVHCEWLELDELIRKKGSLIDI